MLDIVNIDVLPRGWVSSIGSKKVQWSVRKKKIAFATYIPESTVGMI